VARHHVLAIYPTIFTFNTQTVAQQASRSTPERVCHAGDCLTIHKAFSFHMPLKSGHSHRYKALTKHLGSRVHNIRPPAVAGTFYPAQPATLANDVRAMLAAARPTVVAGPKALIVPHAGYIYSGATAAAAYASMAKYAATITRVILLGPAHRVAIRGLALPGANAFATPLGTIELDREAIASLADLPQVGISAATHAAEHSLEVQLPFLQSILGEFKLLPLAVGNASADEVAEVLDRLWGGDETLIVISSDLSHFLAYDQATAIDRATAENILSLQPLQDYQQACGAIPINGLLLAAKRHHLRPQLIAQCNSGDTAGDRQRVVGYASFAFFEEPGNG